MPMHNPEPVVPFSEVFSGGWTEQEHRIEELRAALFAKPPAISPFDLRGLAVPSNILEVIREKNRKRIRNETRIEELVAEDSPFRVDKYVDDQLMELAFSIVDKYRAEDFVKVMTQLVQVFLNESAALRVSVVSDRVDRENAESAFSYVRKAIEAAKDEDERSTLELLLLDLTGGSEESWVNWLDPDSRRFLQQIVQSYSR
jgi:hypothetical protein